MGRSVRRSDVFEIAVPAGFAYLQCVCKNDDYGHLIRILPGVFSAPPLDVRELVDGKELYFVYFPLGVAVARHLVRYVASEPASAGSIPTMRRRGGMTAGGRVQNWWIVRPDGSEELVEALSEGQKQLSLQEIWNDTFLIERISSGWRPDEVT
jgi:hypothetical protein